MRQLTSQDIQNVSGGDYDLVLTMRMDDMTLPNVTMAVQQAIQNMPQADLMMFAQMLNNQGGGFPPQRIDSITFTNFN